MTLIETKQLSDQAAGAVTHSVFVDGGSGTTGLGIAERLNHQGDIAVKHIAEDRRKDAGAKRALMEEVDLVSGAD
jgi:N-acetyl-gamma-glutamyl-phosphate reductase